MTRHDGNDDVPTFSSWTPARTPDEVERLWLGGGRQRSGAGAGEETRSGQGCEARNVIQ